MLFRLHMQRREKQLFLHLNDINSIIAFGAISTSVVPELAGLRCCKIDSEASDHIESW